MVRAATLGCGLVAWLLAVVVWTCCRPWPCGPVVGYGLVALWLTVAVWLCGWLWLCGPVLARGLVTLRLRLAMAGGSVCCELWRCGLWLAMASGLRPVVGRGPWPCGPGVSYDLAALQLAMTL